MIATDVNAQIQTLLLRRAIHRTRYENGTLRDVRRAWRQASAGILHLLRTSGLFHLMDPPRGTQGGWGHLRLTDQQARANETMRALAERWRTAVAGATRHVHGDLLAFSELELLEVPPLIQKILTRATQARLAEAEGEDLVRTGTAFGSDLFQQVPVAQVSQLVTSPLGGARFAQAFEDLSARVLMRIRGALGLGLLRGQSVPTVSRNILGILGGTRWEAERIVRSEYVRVAGQAALMQFDQNKEALKGVRWVSTLDKRTCLQCGKLDGKIYPDARQAPVPVTSTHPHCRCVIVPVVKDLPGFTFGPSTRAAQGGPVPATQTYGTWFGQQDARFQRETLGPTRYKLWSQGQLKLGDFSTASGVRSVADALALARRGQ
jgi:SPP1 gp7 family putative phage head morphogenesis protein